MSNMVTHSLKALIGPGDVTSEEMNVVELDLISKLWGINFTSTEPCKDSSLQSVLMSPLRSSPNVNIPHNHGTFVKTKK